MVFDGVVNGKFFFAILAFVHIIRHTAAGVPIKLGFVVGGEVAFFANRGRCGNGVCIFVHGIVIRGSMTMC